MSSSEMHLGPKDFPTSFPTKSFVPHWLDIFKVLNYQSKKSSRISSKIWLNLVSNSIITLHCNNIWSLTKNALKSKKTSYFNITLNGFKGRRWTKVFGLPLDEKIFHPGWIIFLQPLKKDFDSWESQDEKVWF